MTQPNEQSSADENNTSAEPTAVSPAVPPAPAAPWGVPPTSPAEPVAPPAWTPPPAAADPAPWAAPTAPVAWTAPQAAAEPAPWGAPPPAPVEPAPTAQQPVYQAPEDPFHTTTMTPPGAQTPEPTNPYIAPTYYPAGSAPIPQPVAPYDPNAQVSATPYPFPDHPGYPGAVVAPPKKKHKGLIITAIVLGVLLVLCLVGAAGAFFLLRNTDGQGQDTAKDAAQTFLTAVYKDYDVDAAQAAVCSEARDKKAINAKIDEIKDQNAKLKSPRYTWDTIKTTDGVEQADADVTVKLQTSDEKVAEQALKLIMVKKEQGWFVCEVQEQKK